MRAIVAFLLAYNEEVSAGSVVLRARKYVVTAKDGILDRTAGMTELAGAEVICHPRNRGKGAALGGTTFQIHSESNFQFMGGRI